MISLLYIDCRAGAMRATVGGSETTGGLKSFAFHPDGAILATGGGAGDGLVKYVQIRFYVFILLRAHIFFGQSYSGYSFFVQDMEPF